MGRNGLVCVVVSFKKASRQTQTKAATWVYCVVKLAAQFAVVVGVAVAVDWLHFQVVFLCYLVGALQFVDAQHGPTVLDLTLLGLLLLAPPLLGPTRFVHYACDLKAVANFVGSFACSARRASASDVARDLNFDLILDLIRNLLGPFPFRHIEADEHPVPTFLHSGGAQ